MTSEEYGQYIDDVEMGIDVDPDETLTQYIERRRREFESKADGGAIGIEVLFTDKKPRQKLFMGGPALEGPALSIYNSMSAYGFSDQDIANAIKEAGYELPTAGSTQPETGIINQSMNTIDRSSAPVGSLGVESLVSDYKTQTQNRQNRLTNPNKATEFFNKFTGGGQRDIGEMIRSGEVDQRKLAGIPTVGNIIGKMLPDKYYDMSLGDQVFTQAMSGYTGPTVFGENLGNQDPFGLNVRSGFGNYAEAVGKDFASLRESLTGRLADKYGVEFDEETGMFIGKNAELANKMTNMMRTKFNFRKDQLAAKNRLDAQIKAAEAERQKQIELQKKIEAEAAAGKSLSQIGRENFTGEGQAFQAGNIGKSSFTGGKVKDTGGVPGGKYGSPRKDGGLMYVDGGRVYLYNRLK